MHSPRAALRPATMVESQFRGTKEELVSVKEIPMEESEKGSSGDGRNIQPPRGTHDIMPGESAQWQRLEAQLRAVIQRAMYQEIRLPMFEHTELFKRGVGETTDIVNKEMYTFNDRSDRSLTLRPEGTAGVVRAYLTHGLSRAPQPVKMWYCGPMFRYERTQTGRQRQFHQTGIEAFGSAGPAIDAEVIVLAVDCMHAVGIRNFALHLNSIGCIDCRPAYREKLKEAIRPHLASLCPDCQERFERNPLRMLDCKNIECQKFYKNLPSSLENLCANCQAHWDELLVLLKAVGIEPHINDRLVRGLDYYGRTVFELIADDPRLGAQSTILAGGRYDYLVESLGGLPTPAVGWACGMERITMLMDSQEAQKPLAFIVSSQTAPAVQLAASLRRSGIACDLDYPPLGATPRAFKRQLEKAAKSGARWALILGDQELADKTVMVKNLEKQTQEAVSMQELMQYLQK
jgi:histidyl-tRNA synthetase